MKSASIYKRANKIVLVAYSQVPDGFWVIDGPVFDVKDTSPGPLGEVALKALSCSRTGVSVPVDQPGRMLFASFKVRSQRSFCDGATLCVSITETNGVYQIEPQKFVMKGRYWVGIPSKTIETTEDPTLIGQAILEAFTMTE